MIALATRNACECSLCGLLAKLYGKLGDGYYRCQGCGAYRDTWVGIFERLDRAYYEELFDPRPDVPVVVPGKGDR